LPVTHDHSLICAWTVEREKNKSKKMQTCFRVETNGEKGYIGFSCYIG